MDLERNIYEGWRPIDFINELEPSFYSDYVRSKLA